MHSYSLSLTNIDGVCTLLYFEFSLQLKLRESVADRI